MVNIKKKMPTEKELYELSDLFKIFGDFTRSKILSCLILSPMKVGDICKNLNMTNSAISHQLRILKDAKLVKATRRGKEMVYSLEDNHVALIMECGLSHINE